MKWLPNEEDLEIVRSVCRRLVRLRKARYVDTEREKMMLKTLRIAPKMKILMDHVSKKTSAGDNLPTTLLQITMKYAMDYNDLAYTYELENNFGNAILELRKAMQCGQGDQIVCYKLSLAHLLGFNTVKIDPVLARWYLERANNLQSLWYVLQPKVPTMKVTSSAEPLSIRCNLQVPLESRLPTENESNFLIFNHLKFFDPSVSNIQNKYNRQCQMFESAEITQIRTRWFCPDKDWLTMAVEGNAVAQTYFAEHQLKLSDACRKRANLLPIIPTTTLPIQVDNENDNTIVVTVDDVIENVKESQRLTQVAVSHEDLARNFLKRAGLQGEFRAVHLSYLYYWGKHSARGYRNRRALFWHRKYFENLGIKFQ